MEMTLSNGFCELSLDHMEDVYGGGWLSAAGAFLGGVFVAVTPAACALGGPGVGAVNGAKHVYTGIATIGMGLLGLCS